MSFPPKRRSVIELHPHHPVIPVPTKALQDFSRLRSHGHHQDLVLLCHGHQFPCHKAILSARSTIWSKMLEHHTSGEMEVDNMSKEALDEFLEFVYSGRVVRMEHVGELFLAGDQYGMKDLLEVCRAGVVGYVTEENALEVLLVAHKHNFKAIKQVVMERFSRNISGEDFKKKIKNDQELLMEMMTYLYDNEV